jgi:hypothetical protein
MPPLRFIKPCDDEEGQHIGEKDPKAFVTALVAAIPHNVAVG